MTDYGLSENLPKDDKRQKKWKKQRKERGFDDTELWALDSSITKFILPRLKAFKESKASYPGHLTEKKWDKILDNMIEGFEEHSKYEAGCDYDKIKIGLKLLAKWYLSLWS